MAEWDRAAWICYCTPRMTKRKYTFEDFHPLRAAEGASRRRVNLARLKSWCEEMKKHLPAEDTEENIERRWQEHLDKGT